MGMALRKTQQLSATTYTGTRQIPLLTLMRLVTPRFKALLVRELMKQPEYLDEGGIDAKNEERKEVTPFPAKTYTDIYGARPVGEMPFIKAFFNNIDEFGDTLDGKIPLITNGYLKFEYTRNKYPLRFNNDPSKIKGYSEFGKKTNSLNTLDEFPLKGLEVLMRIRKEATIQKSEKPIG